MDTSGNSDSQLASGGVFNNFTGGALSISACSLFQNGTARMLNAYWQLIYHFSTF